MDINRGSLDALFTGFKTALAQGLGMANMPVERLATVVPSGTAIEKYPILFLLGTMRKWVGDRQSRDIKGNVLAVENDDYEHTETVKRNHIEDDNLGLYNPLFMKMGQDAANLWPTLIINAMTANGNWLDGSPFFGTSRTFGANTISNYTTSALTETTFNAARLAMASYLGHNDQPLGIVPDTLIVGPKNRTVAHGIVNQGPGATAANPNAGAAEVIEHPLLVGTYDDYWFLACTKGVVKPVLLQKRKEGDLVRRDRKEDDCVFKRNVNEYGLHYRGAAALSLPPLMYAGML